jgi:hypothetical protein
MVDPALSGDAVAWQGRGQLYPPAGLDHGDLDNGLAERDGAEHPRTSPFGSLTFQTRSAII